MDSVCAALLEAEGFERKKCSCGVSQNEEMCNDNFRAVWFEHDLESFFQP